MTNLKVSDNSGGIRVLHVDDDFSFLEISKEILEGEGPFEVETVTSVDVAFQKLADGGFDVVVSDYEMPGKNGLDFLGELKEKNVDVPFILFTGKGREEVAIKALNLGADGYHNKQGSTETVYGELAHGIRLATERAKTKSALEESERRYRTLMEQAAEAIFVHDANGQIVDVNQKACESLGYTKEELLSMNIPDISPVADKDVARGDIWAKVLAGGSVSFESTQKRKDKNVFPIEVTLSSIIFDEETLVIALARDITERKKTEVLKESEEQLRHVFNSLPDLVFFKDKTLKYVAANRALEQFLGLKPGEAIGKSDFELLPKEAAQVCNEADMKALQSGFVSADETVGDRVYSTVRQKVTDGAGNTIGVVGSIRDITERAKASENLRNLKAFDERIINSLGDALLVIDPDDYKIITVNEAALKQMKLKKEDAVGKTCYEMTHHRSAPCQPPNDICPIREVLETDKPVTVEHIHLDENNNQRIVEVSARPVKNPEGKTVIIHVARDITERKQMETQIQQAERRYHALFDQTPLGVLIIDPQTGVPVEFNEEAHKQLGYSREEFAKRSIYDYKADETPLETRDRIDKILRVGKAEWETKHRTKNGDVRDVVIISQAIALSGKTFLYSIYRDVTEAKRVEAALMESETKYRMLVELAHEGVWALDNSYKTVFVNPRMAEMLGYTEGEMIGQDLGAFMDTQYKEFATSNLEGCKLGTQSQCEFVFTRQDGTRIYASVAASPIKDDEGNSVGTLALVADISERKKAEEKLEENSERIAIMNEKLRVVGGLTRHDVRNKLTAATGYAYLLKKKHADQADIIDGLGKIEQAVKDSVKIFEFAKMYEQLGAEDLTYVNVEKAANEAASLFSGLTIKVVNDCHGLTVLADSFLRQLFFNFIDNTRKYGKKTTTIRVYFEDEGQDSLRLVYEDDGVGITEENKSNLFKEGFSTGGSTGFGLFLIRKMTEVYGWQIQETGKPGEGAKFVMTIPKANKNGQINYQIQS